MRLLFLDFETTGLGAQAVPVQVGALYCEGPDLEVVSRYEAILDTFRDCPLDVDPVVREMHDRSGLWARWLLDGVHGRAVTLDRARAALLAMCPEPRETMLAGCSVGVDRAWAEEWLDFGSQFSHRVIDVSTIRQVRKAWGLSVPDQAKAHTALADCEEARRELLSYRAGMV
jgi:oligoribonuclease (3'-5' exoribonuclease)